MTKHEKKELQASKKEINCTVREKIRPDIEVTCETKQKLKFSFIKKKKQKNDNKEVEHEAQRFKQTNIEDLEIKREEVVEPLATKNDIALGENIEPVVELTKEKKKKFGFRLKGKLKEKKSKNHEHEIKALDQKFKLGLIKNKTQKNANEEVEHKAQRLKQTNAEDLEIKRDEEVKTPATKNETCMTLGANIEPVVVFTEEKKKKFGFRLKGKFKKNKRENHEHEVKALDQKFKFHLIKKKKPKNANEEVEHVDDLEIKRDEEVKTLATKNDTTLGENIEPVVELTQKTKKKFVFHLKGKFKKSKRNKHEHEVKALDHKVNIEELKTEVEEVTEKMKDNIKKIRDRDGKIEVLLEKAEDLKAAGESFKYVSQKARRKMWLRRRKFKIIAIVIGGLTGLIALVVVLVLIL